jgi:hypothetical protein
VLVLTLNSITASMADGKSAQQHAQMMLDNDEHELVINPEGFMSPKP